MKNIFLIGMLVSMFSWSMAATAQDDIPSTPVELYEPTVVIEPITVVEAVITAMDSQPSWFERAKTGFSKAWEEWRSDNEVTPSEGEVSNEDVKKSSALETVILDVSEVLPQVSPTNSVPSVLEVTDTLLDNEGIIALPSEESDHEVMVVDKISYEVMVYQYNEMSNRLRDMDEALESYCYPVAQ